MKYALPAAACAGVLGLAVFEAWQPNAATSASVGDAGAARPSGLRGPHAMTDDGLTKIGEGHSDGLTQLGDAGAARPSGFGRSIMADGLTKIAVAHQNGLTKLGVAHQNGLTDGMTKLGEAHQKGFTEGMTRLAVALFACTLCVCVTIASVFRKG